MSILDDAIREHLELKRAHGADESEIKKLEDEAFGPPGRPEEPDPVAEAPTEFLTTPEDVGEPAEEGGRRIDIADLQEPPAPAEEDAPPVPAEDPVQAAEPVEEPSAAEHEIVAPPDTGPSTEEREAIAEQPTEFFDVQAEIGSEEQAEADEPKPAPVEPVEEEEEDDDFWSEQRLSDELDQALEAPLPAEPAEEPVSEEYERPEQRAAPEQSAEPAQEDEPDDQHPNYDPDTGHEDVLEDTPDFLEDAPEDDELWFEQRPPKDFDFDD